MSNQPQSPLRTTPKMPVPRPGVRWRRVVLAALVLLMIGVFCWVGYFYHAHTMPNISIAGAMAGNASYAEVERTAERQAAKLRLRLTNDKASKTPTLAEVGVYIDKAATAEAAFNARRLQNMPEGLALWQTDNIPLQLEVNEQVLEGYIAAHFAGVYEAPVQPDLAYSTETGQFELVSGEAGRGFDITAIANKLKARAANAGVVTVAANSNPVPPSVTDIAAIGTQDEANKRLWIKLDFLYQDKLIYFPEPAEMVQWYQFEPDRGGTELVIRYDKARMRAFIQGSVTNSLNNFFGPGGTEPGGSAERLQITGLEALVEDMVDAMQSREPLEKEIETLTVSAGQQGVGL